MGLILWIVILAASAIGTILANVVVDINLIGLPELVAALIWFLIAYTTFFAGKKVEGEDWFKLLSLNFLIGWVFCTVGYILGQLVWLLINTGGLSFQLQQMITWFFFALPLTIGPTATASMGLRSK